MTACPLREVEGATWLGAVEVAAGRTGTGKAPGRLSDGRRPLHTDFPAHAAA